MKISITLVWPWSLQHERTHELFPIGLGYIISNIDPHKYDLHLLDCALEDLQPDSAEFRRRILENSPKVVGISWWSLNTPVVEKTIEVVKSLVPDVILVVGGPHLVAHAKSVVESHLVDYAFIGEAEQGFPQLLDTLFHENSAGQAQNLENIGGLTYLYNNTVRQVPQQFVDDLDLLGGVDYEQTNLKHYHRHGYYYGEKLNKQKKLSAPIMTSRGCPYRCSFCLAPKMNGNRIRRHSIAHIIKSIQSLYFDFGVRYIAIIDDNFTIDHDWTVAVCNAIADLDLKDLCVGTPNGIPLAVGITTDLAEAMKRAGWQEIMIAPESGSLATLKAMKKPVNLDLVPDFIEVFHSAGIKVSAFFIIGYPNETIEDIRLTEKFILNTNFDFVGISIFQPLPGTEIFDRLVQEGTVPADFIPGHYQEVTFTRPYIPDLVLRDTYNNIWNHYRQSRGLPIKNSAVASIRIR